MTVRIISKDPGHDALKLLARWIAEAYMEELSQERLKESAEKNKTQNTNRPNIEAAKEDNANQRYDRGREALPPGKDRGEK